MLPSEVSFKHYQYSSVVTDIIRSNKKDEMPFEVMEYFKSPPWQGYDRYATKMLHRSQDRKYWTDDDNLHKYVMDDYGFLKYVGYQYENGPLISPTRIVF